MVLKERFMWKKLLALSLSVAVLGACSEEQAKQEKLSCDDASVVQTVRNNMQEIIKQEARAFARNDTRQFVDADKIIAAGSQLEISLENPEQISEGNKLMCRANLKVNVPSDIVNMAQTNSPMIYGDVSLAQLLEQKLMGSNMSYANGSFTAPLRFTPSKEGVGFEDNVVSASAQILSASLLPYGVKSIVVIDGKAVSREDALKMNKSEPFSEPAEENPQDILENNAAATAAGVPKANEALNPDAEVLTPKTQEAETTLAYSDLEHAREQNRAADGEINRLWGGMEKTVQQEMLAEQRSWIQSKKQNCLQAAAQADNPAQAEYLQLQCDTRMTRERVQYLRGYTINN